MKNIVIGLLLGVYLFTTSISRIEVFKLVLCSPDSITQESSSSKPKKIDPRPTWNYRRQISTTVKIELPDESVFVKDVTPKREGDSFILPVYDCNITSFTRFSDSSPRSPPLA